MPATPLSQTEYLVIGFDPRDALSLLKHHWRQGSLIVDDGALDFDMLSVDGEVDEQVRAERLDEFHVTNERR